MPKKRQSKTTFTVNKRKPEEIAEERIAEWRKDPTEHDEENRRQLAKRFGARTRILELEHLGLRAVPESIRNLHELENINLERNLIRSIPTWIGELSKIKGINLSANRIQALPQQIGSLRELRILWLNDNQLEELPRALLHLPLRELALENNSKLGIPESLIERSRHRPAEVLRYYFESRAEEGWPLLELKLLLVGRGKAGKTTLVKRLAGENPDENESETHSIAIRELMLNCPRGQVRTRAWDFGGQEILHSTHQFFLTERSLYLELSAIARTFGAVEPLGALTP